MKELIVDPVTAVRGTPGHGFEAGEIQLSPPTIMVAGPKAALDRLQTLYVKTPMDISGALESKLGGSEVRIATELVYASASEVVIQAAVVPAQHTHTYTGIPVEVHNLDPALTARLSQSAQSISIQGTYADVEKLKTGQIHLYVDAAGLGEGEHRVAVQCVLNGMTQYTAQPQNPELMLTLRRR
jgi:YbbR domain-containing protein